MNPNKQQEITIQNIGLRDLDLITKLYADFQNEIDDEQNQFDPQYMREAAHELKKMRQQLMMDEKYYGYIAKINNETIGYIAGALQIQPWFFQKRVLFELTELYIIPTHRNKGYAKTLLKTMIEELNAQGKQHCRIQLNGTAKKYSPLFEKLGFKLAALELRT